MKNRRTQLSAESLLSGFMPNSTEPVPIHTLPHEIDTFFPNYRACPKLRNLIKKIKNEDLWKEHIEKNAELKKKLDGYIGYPLSEDNFGFEKYFKISIINFHINYN